MHVGARLNHYEILSAIGKGGMGEVWKARDGILCREVAIKTLPPELARDSDRVARLVREATSLAAVSHPNVGAIYGLEQDGETRFLVLELVDGDTLADRLLRGPLSVQQALEIALQIAEALEAAHERGVVHRDLKPANIKLTPDDRVKVLDFGLAKYSVPAGVATELTEIGTVMGTAPYMSPEQVRGDVVGPQCDIWAFGVVLYEMLTGASPFARATAAETAARVLEAQPDPALLPPGTPASVRNLLRRCLQKERKRRLKHAGDVRIEVEDALAELSAGAAPAPNRTALSRRAALVGGAAVGLAGVALGAGAFLTQRRVPSQPSYQRVTFRRGMIRTARFGPDFKTILYGALWDGDVCRIYSVRPESPESAALSLPPATPLAVSASGELALTLGTHYRGIMTYGTLARVPLAGDAPRDLQDDVKYADWSPDGRDLVIVRSVGDHDRLELLDGTVLAEPDAPGGGFGFARFSPRGDTVAAFELDSVNGLVGRLLIVDRSGAKRAVSPPYFNVFGLAWRGDEVWFTAADELPLFRNAIHAMDASGAVRLVARVPGNTTLHEAAPDGRLLIARTDDRSGFAVRGPGEATERDLSWLDGSFIADISRDGRRILFSETGVGGGPSLTTYVRAMDGAAAVRLSDGFANALSPDGRWAIVRIPNLPHFDVIPTGAGQASRLERAGLTLIRARCLADGQHVLTLARDAAGRSRLYVLDLGGSTTRPVTPEDVAVGYNGWVVSPDGANVAVSGAQGIALFPLAAAEAAARVVPGTERSTAVGWIDSGLLVSDDPTAGGTVSLVDPTTGRRSAWVDLQARDPAGVMSLDHSSLVVTPDGRAYGYNWHRAVSDLFVVDGIDG